MLIINSTEQEINSFQIEMEDVIDGRSHLEILAFSSGLQTRWYKDGFPLRNRWML